MMFYDDPSYYIDLVPEKLQGIVEINALADTINIQIDKLSAYIKKWINNKSPSYADEDGCTRWEKMLGLSTPLNDTLQARRNAIRAKIMSKPPINLNVLRGIVEAYMDLDVDISVTGYQISIKYRGESKIADLNPLYVTMWDMIPANMLVDIAYLYVIWQEIDGQNLTWAQTDSKNLSWYDWERGEWLV